MFGKHQLRYLDDPKNWVKPSTSTSWRAHEAADSRSGSGDVYRAARDRKSATLGFSDLKSLRVMGMSRDQIIGDVLAQFERYLHLVHSPEFQLVHGAPEHQRLVLSSGHLLNSDVFCRKCEGVGKGIGFAGSRRRRSAPGSLRRRCLSCT